MGAYDGLRGFCAIYVVLFHAFSNHPDFPTLSLYMRSFITVGFEMVPVFFVLSGFFVSRSLASLQNDRSISETGAQTAFILRRAARLMPLWFVLLLSLYFRDKIGSDVFLANLVFYFGDLKIGSKWLPVVPAWSLQAEVLFYCSASLFLRHVKRLTIDRLAMIISVAFLISALWRHLGPILINLDVNQVSWFFPTQLPYFACGIAIERAYSSGFSVRSFINSKWQFYALEAAIAVLFLGKQVPNFFILPTEVLAPLLVLFVHEEAGVLNRFFNFAFLRFAGTISFGIYILQNEAMDLARSFLPSHVSIGFVGITSLLFAVGLAVASYFILERPIIDLSHRLTSRRV